MVKIPTRLDDILPSSAMEKVMEVLHQPDISSSVREALGKVGLKDTNPLGQVQQAWRQARGWLETMAAQVGFVPQNPSIINATGQLLSPEFDGVPMEPSVSIGFAKAATTFQDSQSLRQRAASVSRELFDRPAVWLNSSLVALQLLRIAGIARGGIVISRADAVRVPGFGDVRGMLTALEGELTEVGAANGASAQDWGTALHSNEQVLLLVSPNSLSVDLAAIQRKMAVEAASKAGAKIVELIIDGVVADSLTDKYGFPNAKHLLSSSANLVIMPLHLLLCGPTGAIAVGDEKLIAAIGAAAEGLGATAIGPHLAAATIAVQASAIVDDAGIAGKLLANEENLKNRAQRLAVQLNDTTDFSAAVEDRCTTPLGPTPWDRYRLENWGVRLTLRQASSGAAERMRLEHLRPRLESADSQLPLALSVEGEDLFVDLRFVEPENDHEIVLALADIDAS